MQVESQTDSNQLSQISSKEIVVKKKKFSFFKKNYPEIQILDSKGNVNEEDEYQTT